MNSTVRKRSILVHGRKTSVSLEDAFWNEMKAIARSRNVTVGGLVADIDRGRRKGNLSSALRLFVLETAQRRDETPSRDETLTRRQGDQDPPGTSDTGTR
jgi:predicted DNA-binding ribbon-helix-helix protein